MKFILVLFFLFSIVRLNGQDSETEMILVEGGSFQMGNTESAFHDEYPRHEVSLRSFYIGKYEVTAEQYNRFCRTTGLPESRSQGKEAACGVTWEQAVMYCNWLSSISGFERCYEIDRGGKQVRVTFNPAAKGYRLPTEAEWEYAARGGQKQMNYAYSGSDDAREVAWYLDSGKTIHTVGLLKPNSLGLYDMSGNVKELCWDFYEEKYYTSSPKDNPVGPESSVVRVVRSGSYNAHADMLRVTKRYFQPPTESDFTLGFRVARSQ